MPIDANALHIPEGIRFECSGCGNCCFTWPVPATADDVQRITKLNAAGADTLFKRLSQPSLDGFQYSMEKGADGNCAFLDENKLCSLHTKYGAESKPAMCQLFPYTFTITPSGAFASVSFASTAVLTNCGALLSEQRSVLQKKLDLFQQLFPNLKPDWNKLQLLDGVPLPWERFAEIEQEYMPIASGSANPKLCSTERLLACANVVRSHLPGSADPEKIPPMPTRPKVVDQVLLSYLNRVYLPDDCYSRAQLNPRELLTEIVNAPQTVPFTAGAKSVSFGDLSSISLKDKHPEVEDLLNRFVYCRLFAKLFFGPAMGNLSLLSGLHFLLALAAVLRLRLKASLVTSSEPPSLQATELLRTMERQLTYGNLGGESSTIMEVLFASPSRAERLCFLSK